MTKRPPFPVYSYEPGERVWYWQSVRGGYGCDGHDVPAVYRRPSNRRDIIDVTTADGVLHRIAVSPDRLRLRDK